MTFVLHTIIPSPHQIPIAREIARRVGEENFRYIYDAPLDDERRALGWGDESYGWLMPAAESGAKELLENADVLLSGIREFNLFDQRTKRGLKTFHMSERWFKPPFGVARLALARFRSIARANVGLLTGRASYYYLPIGIHAARDMARLCGLMLGDAKCIFGAPTIDYECRPCGRVRPGATARPRTSKDGLMDKCRLWGYFVEPSRNVVGASEKGSPTPMLRVLWVGRLLALKRVDTLIRAVRLVAESRITNGTTPEVSLDIYGTGPEEPRLRQMAKNSVAKIGFHAPVPISEVRGLMRAHDVYVLSSNGYEGWGAVVSEALEERMIVLGTREAGSTATMLPEDRLFNAGDATALARLLEKAATDQFKPMGIGTWSASNAAKALLALSNFREVR